MTIGNKLSLALALLVLAAMLAGCGGGEPEPECVMRNPQWLDCSPDIQPGK
jgi:hypothetical protein